MSRNSFEVTEYLPFCGEMDIAVELRPTVSPMVGRSRQRPEHWRYVAMKRGRIQAPIAKFHSGV